MARPGSLNDINPIPVQLLNKVQKNKIRQIIIANLDNPETALQLVKDYTQRINKIKIQLVCFDREVSPTGIELTTGNTTYSYDFEKLRKSHEFQQKNNSSTSGV
jgi:hypothetical protein